MKKRNEKIFLGLLSLFLLCSCALIQKKVEVIRWPEDINYMEAECELDMAWMDMKYSGSMSLVMEYPFRLSIEAYSPFGDTVFFLNRYKDYFLMLTGEERYTNEKAFESRFNINIKDFIDDLALKSIKGLPKGNNEVKKNDYKVIYRLDNEKKICWEGSEGRICIKFIEVKFTKEGQ